MFIHPVLSANATERLAALPVKQFITTNTIPMSPEQQALFGGRLTILSIGPLWQRSSNGRMKARALGYV